MNDLILIVIVVVVLLSFFMHYESRYSELTYVESYIDGHSYLVRNKDDREDAANLLANMKKRMINLVKYLEKHNSSDPKVQRLINKFRPDNISESIPNTKYTSYSVNKGEKIVFCIRSKKTGELVDINTMMFVAIHEMAHIMTISIGHTTEFWNNMRYLLKKGIKIGIYKDHDYKTNPVPYCGTQITDSPL